MIPDTRKNLEFVERPLVKSGNEKLPDARRAAVSHRTQAAVPKIEIPDDADSFRVRRPNRKLNALDARNYAHVRAELFIVQVICAFAQQVEVVVGQKGGKA